MEKTCKIGQGKDCCRYILLGAEGFHCGKLTSLKSILDSRVEAGTMIAQADNCNGLNNQLNK